MEEVFVPASGMAMEDALLTEWLKAPGDAVQPGEPIAVVETDKASVELSATTGGVLGRQRRAAGSRVAPGETIAVVLAQGEREEEQTPATASSVSEDGRRLEASSAGQETGASDRPATALARPPHRESPRQRRQAVLAAAAPPPAFSGFANGKPAPAREPASPRSAPPGQGFRDAIAAHVVQSWTSVPHFSVARAIDATELRAELSTGRRFDSSITVTDFLLLALARALAHDGTAQDIGLAVATDRGVQIAVVREVNGVRFEELVRRRKAAVQRAREHRLSTEDTNAPFATLSNLGALGVSWFTGVVPLGQSVLFTTGAITDQPVVEGRGVAIRPEFYATVTADHRRLDGIDSAKLLERFATAISTLGGDER